MCVMMLLRAGSVPGVVRCPLPSPYLLPPHRKVLRPKFITGMILSTIEFQRRLVNRCAASTPNRPRICAARGCKAHAAIGRHGPQ